MLRIGRVIVSHLTIIPCSHSTSLRRRVAFDKDPKGLNLSPLATRSSDCTHPIEHAEPHNLEPPPHGPPLQSPSFSSLRCWSLAGLLSTTGFDLKR